MRRLSWRRGTYDSSLSYQPDRDTGFKGRESLAKYLAKDNLQSQLGELNAIWLWVCYKELDLRLGFVVYKA